MSNRRKISLAISTCPNDTFAFHAILNRKIDLRGLEFDVQLLDIQQLNDGLFSGKFDVAKASFHAAILLADQTVILPVGAALGFGVGPLLLAAESSTTPGSAASQLTLCPGQHTTAALLFQLFYPNTTRVEHALFSDIMPALEEKRADFGVCIHEGRFTFEQAGLHCVADLGTRWEQQFDCPLPLGGILARRALDKVKLDTVVQVIRESIEYGLQHRQETLATMREHAQELADDVIFQHVDLYVNDWTLDLGDVGRRALHQLAEAAQQAGISSGEKPDSGTAIQII